MLEELFLLCFERFAEGDAFECLFIFIEPASAMNVMTDPF